MDFEDKKECEIVKVDGFIEKGKQFDLEINLPEDNRNVIYGIVRDCYKEPVEDAVVKLIEVSYECEKQERKPVSHTFTDKHGELVFGPFCPYNYYELKICAIKVRHCKICTEGKRHGKCLKGVKLECKDFRPCCKEEHEPECK